MLGKETANDRSTFAPCEVRHRHIIKLLNGRTSLASLCRLLRPLNLQQPQLLHMLSKRIQAQLKISDGAQSVGTVFDLRRCRQVCSPARL